MDRTRIIFIGIIGVAFLLIACIVGFQFVSNFGGNNDVATGELTEQPTALPRDTVLVTLSSSNTKQNWLNAVVEKFNAANVTTADGNRIVVQVSHVTSGDSMEAILDGRSQPTINVATDFMVNGLWPVERMSAFVVASEAARARLVRRGYPTQHIHALGIPVAAHFATQAESQTRIRSRLGLANKPTLLAITGSLHNEPYVQSARVMSELFALWGSEETAVSPHADLQIVVITGRNRENLLILQSLVQRLPWPVTLLPFVDNIGEWMVASDLMVTKPGGVTTAEALSCAVPMLLLGIGPGQEQANADLLVNEGCAVIGAKETAILGAQILRLLGDDERLAQMRAACWGLARPDAAQEIARLAQCVAQAETIYE